MRLIQSSELEKDYFDDEILEDIPIVNQIVEEVRLEGDLAVRKYTVKFDQLDQEDYQVSADEITQSYHILAESNIKAIKQAAENIEKFAKLQHSMFKDLENNELGYRFGHKIIPIEKVGCYVPGGSYPLPSSALMTVIPARVAGVEEIVVCSPNAAPETIVAADIAGADKIFKIGGAQAIGAMAYGTETVPRVDKIVGPGNKYVTAAKKRVYGTVGIDFLAGPSEVMVIADDTADPEIVAADLLAQAEHDVLARSDLLTNSLKFANRVKEEVAKQLELLKTREIAQSAINNSSIIVVNSWKEAVDIANRRAPEHLELQLDDNDEIQMQLRNYGSLFIGSYSAEVFGDYCSGPNHTLPTNRVARYSGGLSVKEYVKVVTFQELQPGSMRKLIATSSELAKMEGLHAHQRAAEIRTKLLNESK